MPDAPHVMNATSSSNSSNSNHAPHSTNVSDDSDSVNEVKEPATVVPAKQRGGFNPSRLGELHRPGAIIPRIVGSGGIPRPAGGGNRPTPLIPPATPAQRALKEEAERPHAEPKGFTEVRIIGVGGGGGNAVNRMIEAGVSGVEFIAVNTDPQALDASQAGRTVHLGGPSGRRLGAGGDPEVGRRSAEESEAELEEIIGGADMVFITAGLGGGTGTGAAPVIARLARRQKALTVGVVTLPFRFEGARRLQAAQEGLDQMRESVDALIVIPNDRLLNVADRHTSMVQAFRLADDMLRHGVQGIADLVTVTGLINLDFADVRSVMEDAGSALMAMGQGSGPDRAKQAAQAVISSPLLEHSIAGAKGILLNITGAPDLTLYEVSEVAEYVTEAASSEVNIIFGAVIHPRPEAELRVTLIATGMPEPALPVGAPRPASRSSYADSRQERSARSGDRLPFPTRQERPERSERQISAERSGAYAYGDRAERVERVERTDRGAYGRAEQRYEPADQGEGGQSDQYETLEDAPDLRRTRYGAVAAPSAARYPSAGAVPEADPQRDAARERFRTLSRSPREARDDRDARDPRDPRDGRATRERPARGDLQLPDDADPLDVPPFLRRLR